MKVTISLEARFLRTPDRRVWTDITPDFSFWQRYLTVFDSVEVLARVEEVSAAPPHFKRADGAGVSFIALPHYIGPMQYLRQALKIRSIVKAALAGAEAVILRTPGQVSSCLFRELSAAGHPFAVEVVGDPYDVFAPGSVRHPLRPFFRRLGTLQLKRHCRSALGASYVTDRTLQQRYPNAGFCTSYSSIDIGDEAYAPAPRLAFGEQGVFRLVFVGTLAQLYKGQDVLIDAVAICKERGQSIRLKMIGDGQSRPLIEEQVARLGLTETVQFLGQLTSSEAVRKELLQSDLFVLASRGEGLPRAMIEAMACGLPCIGSTVSGIPELLPAADLVPPGQKQALADKIGEIIADPERMRAMSVRNLGKSREFKRDILDMRRREFYHYLRSQTDSWLIGRKGNK